MAIAYDKNMRTKLVIDAIAKNGPYTKPWLQASTAPGWASFTGDLPGPITGAPHHDPLYELCAELVLSVRQTGGRYVTARYRTTDLRVDILEYVAAGCGVVYQASVGPNFHPPEGFRAATDQEQDCNTCVDQANRYLHRKVRQNISRGGADLCRTCMRSPVEYLLARAPEHAIWFERAVAFANANK